ncbi:MAG: DUF72 domain-containing protein [Phycisphaerales bacterium]|jgi:uncharacterized protein YecE (DUF72 family)
MPDMRDVDGQGFLFGEPPPSRRGGTVELAPAAAAWSDLGRRLPPSVRLGTSSWAFPGWEGIVYGQSHAESKLASDGLAAYSRHPLLRTVGLDRAFYRPPSTDDFRRLASQVPAGFRFLIKAYQGLTRPFADASGRTHGDTRGHTLPSDVFLDASFAAHEVIAPSVRGLGEACGPIVLQFPPMDLKALGGEAAFLNRLQRFLERVHADPACTGAVIGVEVRHRGLLSATWARDFVSALGPATPVLIVHPTMPGLAEQSRALAAAGCPSPSMDRPRVIRWLLRPNLQYEQAKELYAPFNRLAEEDTAARREVAACVAEAIRAASDAYVIINNKAEGSAPLSAVELAKELDSMLKA